MPPWVLPLAHRPPGGGLEPLGARAAFLGTSCMWPLPAPWPLPPLHRETVEVAGATCLSCSIPPVFWQPPAQGQACWSEVTCGSLGHSGPRQTFPAAYSALQSLCALARSFSATCAHLRVSLPAETKGLEQTAPCGSALPARGRGLPVQMSEVTQSCVVYPPCSQQCSPWHLTPSSGFYCPLVAEADGPLQAKATGSLASAACGPRAHSPSPLAPGLQLHQAGRQCFAVTQPEDGLEGNTGQPEEPVCAHTFPVPDLFAVPCSAMALQCRSQLMLSRGRAHRQMSSCGCDPISTPPPPSRACPVPCPA